MTPRKVIVLVDDEKSYTELIAELLLENLDCQVLAFTSAIDALAKIPEIDVGVVVTDYSMPKLNGLEFVKQARLLLPLTPFIVITGHTVGLPEEEFAQISAVKTILYKPLRWRHLAEEILRVWPDATDIPTLKPPAGSLL